MRSDPETPTRPGGDRAFLSSWAIALVRFVGLAAVGLIWTKMVARSLGEFGTGQVFLSVWLAPLLAPVVDLGMPAALTYLVAQERHEVAHLRWAAVRAALALGAIVLAGAAVVGVVDAAFDVDASLIFLGVLAVPSSLAINFVAAIEQGRERFGLHALLLLMPSLLALLSAAALEIRGAPGAREYVLSWVVAHGVVAVIALLLTVRHAERPDGETEGEIRRGLLSFGWKVWLSEAAISARNRLDLFLVGGISGTASAGLYGGASRVAQQLGIVSQAANFVVFPMVARASSTEAERIRLTPVIARLTGLVAIVGAAVMAVGGRFFLTLFLDAGFEDAYTALLWYLPTVVFLAISRVVTADLQGRGRPDIMWKIALFTLVVSVGLSLIAIPQWGIEGAAAAASATALLNLVLRAGAYHRLSGVSYVDLVIPRPSDIGRLLHPDRST